MKKLYILLLVLLFNCTFVLAQAPTDEEPGDPALTENIEVKNLS
jgi:hypothetical protein